MFYKIYRLDKEIAAGTEEMIAMQLADNPAEELAPIHKWEDWEDDLQNLEDESIFDYDLKDFCKDYGFNFEEVKATPKLIEDYLISRSKSKSSHIDNLIGVTKEEAYGLGLTLKGKGRYDDFVDVLNKDEFVEYVDSNDLGLSYEDVGEDDIIIVSNWDEPIIIKG